MTTKLEKAISELNQLPESEQNAIAGLIEDELLWEISLKNSQQQLENLADEALREFQAGRTKAADC
ncbi:hypothetical protein GCM10023189_05900 [Nibrella saemangeumensis]|uniref:Addiction module component n=1 Tax=Nibrella saemangeumensis TaxID=1084526 RepID=A0ABP8MFE2_9BACT